MEEMIGKLWDRWLTQRISSEFSRASVILQDLQSELSLFFRALGGEPGRTIEVTDRRKIHLRRSGLQRIAGSHQKIHLPWHDERSVRLPPKVAIFPDKHLNESLYFWWVAIAAYLPYRHNWFNDNQKTIIELMLRYPGLKKQYAELLEPTLALRPEIALLPFGLQQKERAIQQALREPGSVQQLPLSGYDVSPVTLWLYTAPPMLHVVQTPADKTEHNNESAKRNKSATVLKQRKQAQRIDDERKTDGLLVFLPDSLMSWTEQVNLDRPQDEDDDDDPEQIAADLDLITVSRQRKATAAKVKFDLDLPAEENDELSLGPGIRLPEWNYKKSRLVPDACLLQPMLTENVAPVELPSHLVKTSHEVKQLFATLGLERIRRNGQASGEELDLDAWLDDYTRPIKDSSKQNFFIDQRKELRDFSCLILADLSLSTEGYVNDELRVIDVIRDSLLVFSEALNQLRDEFAIYGFSSVRNSHIRYHLIKNFKDNYNDYIRGRINRIKPGFYTRMGAAIRQSTRVLKERAAANRILLILSDGKPNDLDQYEGRYGIEDTRQAIIEARKQGLTPYCVTIDPEGHEYLPFLFGRDGFAVVTNPDQLVKILPLVYLNLSTH